MKGGGEYGRFNSPDIQISYEAIVIEIVGQKVR